MSLVFEPSHRSGRYSNGESKFAGDRPAAKGFTETTTCNLYEIYVFFHEPLFVSLTVGGKTAGEGSLLKKHPSIESPPGGVRRDRVNATGENMRMPSSTAACRYLRFAAFAAVISSELLKAARTSICNFCRVSGYRSMW